MRRMAELFWLALGSLRRTPLRVALTAFGVAIATGALLSMLGFALGIQQKAEEPFQKLELLNRIDVSVKDDPDKVTPPSAVGRLDDVTVGRLARLPGVVVAYPELRHSHVEVKHGAKTATTTASALPLEAGRFFWVRDALATGRFLENSEDEALIDVQLAKEIGLPTPAEAVGQPLTLVARGLVARADGALRPEEQVVQLKIVGVVQSPGGRWEPAVKGVILSEQLMKRMPGVGFSNSWDWFRKEKPKRSGDYERVVVRVERPSYLFTVERSIQEMGYRTHTLVGQFKEIRTAFVLMDLVLTAVGGVALVVAGLGIVNTMLMAVLERYREIGMYKALGASNNDVRVLFLTEAALVGLLGGVGGMLLGPAVSWAMEVLVNHVAEQNGVDEELIHFLFPAYLLAGTLLFATAVSVLSGIVPASHAARVDPIRALRGE